jgi:hypothetical protein
MTYDTTNVTASHFTGELMSVPGTGKAEERRRTRPAFHNRKYFSTNFPSRPGSG